MKTKSQMKFALAAVTALVVPSSSAADKLQEGAVFIGEITPKFYFFDYFKGVGANSTQFLERYNTQEGMGGDSRSGFYLDADLNIVATDAKRNVFVLERQGFGVNNHRGTLKADSDTLGLSGYYSHFRSATGGIDFLYSPGQVTGGTDPTYFFPAGTNANTGYVAQFNNDSPGQSLFKIDRTTYGAALALKPSLFDGKTAASFDYDGYKRDGNRFATYVLGNGDVNCFNPPTCTIAAPATRVLERWRGFDKPVDETMNRITLNLTGSPAGFTLAYEGALEKFGNQAKTFTVGDFAANIQTLANGITPSGAVLDPAILTRAIHFVPDSTLFSNNFRFAKNFGGLAVAAGYGLSILDQDTFSQEQQDASYNTGKITTNSAYLNVNSNVLNWVGLEGFIKYNNRDNGSTLPAADLIDTAGGELLDVRLNRIETLNYGLAATFRPGAWKSAVTAGWKRVDEDRDLTWSDPAFSSIQPHESLYKEKTVSDELYVKWIARPMPGMILRVTPSYVSADKTGLISEPEEAVGLKSMLSYTDSKGMMVSGFYNYKNAKNNNNALTDSTATGTPAAASVRQDNDKTQQAAGVSLNMPFGEWINTSASLSWMQDDFASDFLRSTRRRYEGTQTVLFANTDRSNYNVDTYVFTLGGDWQANDELRYNGGYAFSQSKGHAASGIIQTELPSVDGSIDNSTHTLTLGGDYAFKKNMKLRASYAYDYYTDKVYSTLTGGYHTLMFGVSVGL
jgi:predicted porin